MHAQKKKKKKEKGKFKGDAAAENTAAALTGRGGGFSYDEHPDVAAMSAKVRTTPQDGTKHGGHRGGGGATRALQAVEGGA